LRRVAQFDKVDSTGFNTGFGAVLIPDTTFAGDTTLFRRRFTVEGLKDGFKYFVAVTSFDTGDPQTGPLEGLVTLNEVPAVPMPAPGERGGGVVVFPNPYRVEARWDAGRLVRDHYLWFANLPPQARLKIFTLAGDLVFETHFDGRSYAGENARGVYNPATDLVPQLSGTSFAWNMISSQGQAVATGLYLFAVEDLASGDRQVGKFLIVKSDREGY
jgi:hypothetical protein